MPYHYHWHLRPKHPAVALAVVLGNLSHSHSTTAAAAARGHRCCRSCASSTNFANDGVGRVLSNNIWWVDPQIEKGNLSNVGWMLF